MESTVKLYSLPFTGSRTYLVAGALVAGNVLLPVLCHLIPQGGLIFLPIYFFTLLGAYKYGLKAGMMVAVLSPLVNHLLTGMPPAGMLAPILVKSVLIAVAASFAARKLWRVSIPILLGVVMAYQTAGTLYEWIYTGSLFTALQDFRLALPGMVLQVLGVYGILKLMGRYGY